ncbi:hypothetical protein Rsub_12684, partial [Raphidocelis subcapitata]
TWNRPPQKRLREFASNGIFTSDTFDPDWASIHGLLPRFYNALKIQVYYPQILDKTRSFMLEWSKITAGATSEGVLIDHINDWFSCMTADAVVKCSIGVDMRNVERKGSRSALHPFIRVFRQGIGAALGSYDLKQELGAAYYCPFVNKRAAMDGALKRARVEMEELVSDLVERTRRGEIGDANSVIAAMLNDKAPNTGEYVRLGAIYGHLINLMVAGHETTATTLAWTLVHLARSPECEARALQEIKDVLGDAPEPTAEHIPKFVYLEACFREALRLHSPVTGVGRDAAADTIIKGKWLVRRGQRIMIVLAALHHREDIWGGPFGDPCEFNPERFMPGAAEKAGLPPRHPQAYVPWGFGVRSCIGQLFALWEAKTFLAMLLPRFRLRLPAGYVPVPSNREGGATPLPHGLAFYVHPRPNAPPVVPPAAPAAATAAAAAAPAAPPAAAAAPAGASHGTPLAVLFGSNSGMCEDFSQQLATKARAAGFAVTISSLDAAIAGGAALPAAGAVAVLTSTYNGQPPDNAAAFAKWLDAAAAGSAAGVKFSVYGVGNSQWAATFQAFPKRVAAGLARAGAAPLLPLSTVDVDQAGVSDAFEEWGDALVSAMLSAFQVASPSGPTPSGAPPKLRVTIEPAPPGAAASGVDLVITGSPSVPAAELDAIAKFGESVGVPPVYRPLEVLVSRELLPPESARRTRHVELALPPGMDYSAGDHLEILPMNSSILVKAALFALGLDASDRLIWTAGSKPDGAARGIGALAAARGGPNAKCVGDALCGMRISLPAEVALSYLADLAAVPSRRVISALAEAAAAPAEVEALRRLASEEGYAAGVSGPKLTLIELLLQFKSAKMSLSEVLNALPRLSPRYYSISSSPLADPRRCSITVGLVSYTSPTGRAHRGAASGMIHSQPVGEPLIGTVRVLQSTFKLPKDPTVPIIMVGPGTGLAPMMGFMQERDALLQRGGGGKKSSAGAPPLGPALLFFGCRSADEDYIYKDRLEGYLASGVISGLHTAFSRDGPSKVYVQDLIEQQGPKVWELLEAGAYIYVCGDARRMAPDVRRAFMAVAQKHGSRSEASAQNWMGSLMEGKRYLEDTWAG